ncbi:MAG: hypothetical protein LWX56_14555, partial [Ignavibacteria bacterium]|nr:hypothetical protein [Ignavibacteria bacterium]
PSTYTIESSGERTGTVIMDKVFRKHEFKLSKAHDFAWSATKDYPKETFSVSKSDGEKTQVTIICPPLYKNYIDRYKTALQNAFRYFNYYFAPYPYKTLTLVVTPAKTGRVASMEYPGLITIEHSPFALVQSLQIEKRIIHEFAHQYFYAAVANNETYEGWLDEGLANYLTSRMLDDFGLYEISHFTLFGYLPVQGLELVSIGEIPLVYTLTKVKVPNQSEAMQLYYEHMNEAALCDTSYLLNPYSQYAAITYGKGELFFKTLERISGKEAFMSILKNYYIQNRFKHVKAKDFFDILRRMQRKNIDWLTTNYYKNSYECDYAVESVKYIPERKEARVTVTKKNEGYFPCELSLFTAQDTLTRTVAIDKRRIVVTFSTALPPLGAEIDMNRKNYFDTDFANNSLILSPNMEAPTYISIRWFFWMQSFLLIFGSIV